MKGLSKKTALLFFRKFYISFNGDIPERRLSMFEKMRKIKWIFTVPWINQEWAQQDYDVLKSDPDIEVITYGYAPMIGNDGEILGTAILFTVKSTKEKYECVKDVLKETHREETYMGMPILKCSSNLERVSLNKKDL